ncbi:MULTISPECIES: ADP-ribosyltransferase, partial [Paenibacillus]|uniref:ADP-ribosyltransferase n=1 Tax=Paenibacillus TaxID=44249 RepID=UPI001FD0B8AF
GVNLNKSGLTTEQDKYYRTKINDAEARGDIEAANNARYERYIEKQKNLDKEIKPREEWDSDRIRMENNRQRGRVEEESGRKALEQHLGQKLDNNNTGEIRTHTSSEGHVTRPDSIGRSTNGEINLVHDHKHKTGEGQQVIHNDSQMRAQREMLEDKVNGLHVVTLSSDKPSLADVPPSPRPSAPLGEKSKVYYTDPLKNVITHVWETNPRLPGGGRWKKL